MTEIVKLLIDGEEHWTGEGSPVHQQFLAQQQTPPLVDAPDVPEIGELGGGQDAGQREEAAGADQQPPTEVAGAGDDHNPLPAGDGSGDGPGDDPAAARGTRRSRQA